MPPPATGYPTNGPSNGPSTGEPLVIRDALDPDMTSIHAIYSQAVLKGTASFEAEPPSLAEMLARRARILAHPGPYLVATGPNDTILGYAYAGPYHTRHAYRFTVENTVYVAQSAMRQGAGLALMHVLIERCAKLGYRQMIAVIGGDNPASIALHERAGFRVAGRLSNVGHKFNLWLDTTLMQREL